MPDSAAWFIDGPTLITVSGLPDDRARRLIYLLTITKAVAPFEGGQARVSPAPSASEARP